MSEQNLAQMALMEEFQKTARGLRELVSDQDSTALTRAMEQMLATYEKVEQMHADVRIAEARAREAETMAIPAQPK